METNARRSEESAYFREGEVICRQVFEEKRKTLRLIHTIGFSERSREKGWLEDWMVSTDVVSYSWRNISVTGVWRVWNYSCCNFSEYIFGVPRCTIKYLCFLWRPVWEERFVCELSEVIRYMHPNCSQIACCIFSLSISPLYHKRAVTKANKNGITYIITKSARKKIQIWCYSERQTRAFLVTKQLLCSKICVRTSCWPTYNVMLTLKHTWTNTYLKSAYWPGIWNKCNRLRLTPPSTLSSSTEHGV